MQPQMLMLEAELFAKMLLAVVQTGFLPKVHGHHSTSYHERLWPTGRVSWPVSYLQHDRFYPRKAAKCGPPTDPPLPAASSAPSPRFPLHRASSVLAYSPPVLAPSQPNPCILLQLRPTIPTSTASHPCLPISCDMNRIVLPGGSLVCLQDD